MSSASRSGSKGDFGDHAGPGAILLVLVGVNAALGVLFLLFLLALPSDPENAVVGRYSAGRVLLVSGILAATIALAVFGLALRRRRGLRTGLGERLYGSRAWVRRSLPAATLLLISLYAVPLLFLPAQLAELSKFHYIRLTPYLLWPWALLVSLVLAPWIVWARPRLHVPPQAAEGIAIVCLFLVSFAARAPLSGYGLPYQAIWDEIVTYTRALEILSGKVILEDGTVPGFGRASYGDPVIYVTAAGQATGMFALLRTGDVADLRRFTSPPEGVATVFEAVHDSGVPLRYPRLLFSLINSLTPVLIYVALRRYFEVGVWAAIAGGLAYAVFSPDVVYYSAIIGADGFATTLAVAASVCAMEVIQASRITWLPELACGLLAGITVSVSLRYAGLIFLPFIALGLARSHQRWPARFGVMAAGLAVGFLATSPTMLSDLPVYLGRLTGLTWVGDGSLKNRVISLGYYLRGAFLSRGLGLIVLLLSLVGYTASLRRRPRQALLLTALAILHLLAITPTIFRVTRHALVLYPMAAMFAAVGLDLAQERASVLLAGYQAKQGSRGTLAGIPRGASGLLVFLLFLAVSSPRMVQTNNYVESVASFKPSQVRMAEFVKANLEEGTRIGLLDIVPFTDEHLQLSGADVQRVGLHVTMDELRRGDLEYVIGTNLIGKAYGPSEDTIWVSDVLGDQEKVVALGTDGLSRGWPLGNILLYLSRVPPLEAEP